MKKIIFPILAAATILSLSLCTPTSKSTSMNKIDDNEAQQGWQSLFDGNSTKGWHVYGGKNSASWKAMDGTLFLDTTSKSTRQRGDLVTDEEFENYHLSLEWKVAKGSNGGVIFNVQEDAAKYRNTYETGPEMQVLDNERHGDAKIHKHRAGDLYDLIASSKETVKPAEEWNLAEIKLNKGKLDFFLNGTNVVSTTMWDDNWKQMVAGSKFKNMPGFGTFQKGHIALQDHGDPVWFRNIKIRKL